MSVSIEVPLLVQRYYLDFGLEALWKYFYSKQMRTCVHAVTSMLRVFGIITYALTAASTCNWRSRWDLFHQNSHNQHRLDFLCWETSHWGSKYGMKIFVGSQFVHNNVLLWSINAKSKVRIGVKTHLQRKALEDSQMFLCSMSQPHIYQTKSSNQVVWKITVLNLTNLAKPDAEMRIGESTLKYAMYKNESQKQPKLLLSPGSANIQHIDETSKPL